MKKAVLCGAIIASFLCTGTAIAGPKWGQWGFPMDELERGFERIDQLERYESSQYEQSIQWDRMAEKPLADVSKLYKAGILKKQYFKRNMPTVEVGTNFYHLSGQDMEQVIRSFDTVHNYTAKDGRMIRILDGVTREEVGTYGPEGLILQ